MTTIQTIYGKQYERISGSTVLKLVEEEAEEVLFEGLAEVMQEPEEEDEDDLFGVLDGDNPLEDA